jgi:hypothetical protein
MNCTFSSLLATALTVVTLQAAAAPATYHITMLPEGRSYSAFNDLGQAVSGTELYDSRSGSFTNLVTAPAGWSMNLLGLNNAGDAYGLMGNGTELLNFVYHDGDVRSFARQQVISTHPITGLPYYGYTMPTGINNSGELAVQWYSELFNDSFSGRMDVATGAVITQKPGLYGALSDNGSMAVTQGNKVNLIDANGQVQYLPYQGLTARALNDEGQLAGSYGNNGFFYDQGVLTSFRDDTTQYNAQGEVIRGVVGGSVLVNGINEDGQVVGKQGALGSGLGYLYSDGQFQYLNDITDLVDGWNIVDASSINELGEIGARACKAQDISAVWTDCVSVLLVPDAPTQTVPEPQSAALLVVGLGALSWARRRNRAVASGDIPAAPAQALVA